MYYFFKVEVLLIPAIENRKVKFYWRKFDSVLIVKYQSLKSIGICFINTQVR